jgi:hypothetical protein
MTTKEEVKKLAVLTFFVATFLNSKNEKLFNF